MINGYDDLLTAGRIGTTLFSIFVCKHHLTETIGIHIEHDKYSDVFRFHKDRFWQESLSFLHIYCCNTDNINHVVVMSKTSR